MAPKRAPSGQKAAPRGMEARLRIVEDHYEVLNRELGEVVGELRTIKWLGAGTFVTASVALVQRLFGG